MINQPRILCAADFYTENVVPNLHIFTLDKNAGEIFTFIGSLGINVWCGTVTLNHIRVTEK